MIPKFHRLGPPLLGTPKRIQVVPCPHCAYPFTGIAGVGHEQAPTPGDLNVCARCGGISVFEEGGGARRATATEEEEATTDPELAEAVAYVRGILLRDTAAGGQVH